MPAEAIAKAFGGRKVGAGWMTRCPAHDDRAPSLSITVAEHDKVLGFCHAAGEQHMSSEDFEAPGPAARILPNLLVGRGPRIQEAAR